MSRRPLLGVAGCLGLGCLLGTDIGTVAAGALLALGGVLLLLGLLGDRASPAAVGLGAAAVAIGAAGAAVERAAYEATPLKAWVEGRGAVEDPVQLSGVAAGDASDYGDRYLLVLDVERLGISGAGTALPGRVRVEIGGTAARPEIMDGDRVSLWAQLRPPRGFATPGAFDARGQARHEGIAAFGYSKSFRLVELKGRGDVSWPRGLAAQARQAARRTLRAWILAGPEEGLVRAMVLGDRTGVDETTAEAFRVAGTYHVLALSGAQVALVAGLLLAGLRWLSLPPLPVAAVVSAALAFYAVLVGGDVAVVRAAVMGVVLVVGRAIDLDSDLANLLGLAALLLLVHRPSNIGDVGFQLSFVGTLGLLLLAPPLLAGVPRLPLRLEAGLLGSVAAQATLFPLLADHFHRLSPVAVLLNLLAVPLSGAVLLAGLAVLVAAWLVPWAAPAVGDLAWMTGHCLRRSSELALLVPGLDLRVSGAPLTAVAVYLAGLALVMRGRRGLGLALAGLALGWIVHGPGPHPGDGRLHLTVLDVGQGDCLVVRSPRGRVWLVDSGGSPKPRFDVGEAVVGPFLWSLGVRRIEGLVLTHAHPDHVGGAPFLLRAFRIVEVWEGLAPRQDATYRSLDEALCAAGMTRRAVARGTRMEWDGVQVEVLGPRPRGRPPWRTRNDDSVVLALRFGGVVLLLTGDIESAGEEQLGAPRADVLKVPHHGSRSSSGPSFVAATSPRVAVVSVGVRNPFGHPNGDVLRRYERLGARVFRTDRDGTVTIATDGRALWAKAFSEALPERLP